VVPGHRTPLVPTTLHKASAQQGETRGARWPSAEPAADQASRGVCWGAAGPCPGGYGVRLAARPSEVTFPQRKEALRAG